MGKDYAGLAKLSCLLERLSFQAFVRFQNQFNTADLADAHFITRKYLVLP